MTRRRDRERARAQSRLSELKPFDVWLSERPRTPEDIETYRVVLRFLRRIAGEAEGDAATPQEFARRMRRLAEEQEVQRYMERCLRGEFGQDVAREAAKLRGRIPPSN